jgi:dTDP-4-amino-4,6-dideoxygalactose transaminase
MIAYFDYRPEYRSLESEINAAMRRVIDSGRLILGPEVAAFESEFAAFVGSAGAVGVASGTDALILALRAVGIGGGDEVITVANAGVPPVAAIRAVGARPRFVDVDPESLLLDPAGLEGALRANSRALLPVHLYGRPVPMEPLLEFASRNGLAVIEDCAQAHGARIGGRHVGTFGDVGCFSFYPTKNLGAFGDGGLCVAARPELEQRLRRLRMYGFGAERSAEVEGLNSRLDELQAAILRVKLRRLDEALAARRELARAYIERLRDSELRHPAAPAGSEHAYHLFVIETPRREPLIRRLQQSEIGYGIHYPHAVHTMPAYAFLDCAAGALPRTERACSAVLSLPLYPGLGEDAVRQVARTVLDGP